MNIYLVRHGETELNRNKIHQLPTTPLSASGRKQARDIIKLLSKVKINKLYSSDLLRARQTAEIIANELNLKINIVPELKEIKKPSEILGKKHTDPLVLKINELIRLNYEDDSWRHSDEEKFDDVRIRIDKFMHYLSQHNDSDNILVVTHNYIIKMFLALTIFDEGLTSKTYLKFYSKVGISNASLSKIHFSKEKGWRLAF